MATIKITALVEDASPTTDDLIYTVNAPGGVPASKKVTIANLLALVDEIRDADGDTKVQVEEAGDEDKIRFDTGGTERLVLDSASLRPTVDVIPAVGKGITDADGDTKVQVEEGADEDKVRIDCGADGEKALFSTVGTESYVQINTHRDEDGDTQIQVEEAADEDKIRFDTGGTERAVLDSTGLDLNVLLDLISGQIAFPATAVPSADANTLDDYEEGTFEVGLTCGTSGTITNDAGTEGSYVKISKVVTFLIYISVASVSSPVGRLWAQGFPFTCGATYSSCGQVWANNLNAGYGDNATVYSIEAASTTANIDRVIDGTITTDVAAAIKATSDIRFSGHYYI